MSVGLTPKTINNHLALLRRALVSAVEWELLDVVPRIKPMNVPPGRIDFLTDEECERLVGTRADPHWEVMVLLALRTGLRQGELLALEWQDIAFQRRRLTVQRSFVRGNLTSPKSNKVRHIPMTRDLVEALGDLPRTSRLVFPREGGGHRSDSMANKALERIGARAELRHLHWHLFRHTFASQLVRRGIPLRKVQLMLGHSTIQMTERYAHMAPSDLDDAVAVLEPGYQAAESILGQPAVNADVHSGALKQNSTVLSR